MIWKSIIAGLAVFCTMTTAHAENPKMEEIRAVVATGKYIITYDFGNDWRVRRVSDGDKVAVYVDFGEQGKNRSGEKLHILEKDGKIYEFRPKYDDKRKETVYIGVVNAVEEVSLFDEDDDGIIDLDVLKFIAPKDKYPQDGKYGERYIEFLRTEETAIKMSEKDKTPIKVNCDHYNVKIENAIGEVVDGFEHIRCYWLPSDGSIKRIELVTVSPENIEKAVVGNTYDNIQISGEVSDDMFTIPKGTKVYKREIGGMEELLGKDEKGVLVEEY